MDDTARKSFARFAWGLTGYNLLVILWGAWVRITGSGAGCGEHWPTCHGEIIPRDAGVETIIELTHRATSGLTLIFTVVLVWKAVKVFSKENGRVTGRGLRWPLSWPRRPWGRSWFLRGS